jgi:hypothetical protein
MKKITSKADLMAVYEAAKGKLALRLAAGSIDSKKKDILCCGGTGCHASNSQELMANLREEIKKAGLYESPNQIQSFCECVYSRKPTISPAEVGGRSCTLCLLCNMSYVYDTGFDWDPAKMEIVGANPKGISIKRDHYRNGWEIEV